MKKVKTVKKGGALVGPPFFSKKGIYKDLSDATIISEVLLLLELIKEKLYEISNDSSV